MGSTTTIVAKSIKCVSLILLLSLNIYSFFVFAANELGAKTHNTPMHEILQKELYITITSHGEISVAHSGKGADLKRDDKITHADGIRIVPGGQIGDFITSGEKEILVPVVDDTDIKFGGSRFLNFVLLQSVQPRKLTSRRGEIRFDLEEGGPPPSLKLGNVVMSADGVRSTTDSDYEPPPHGGGKCITGKDCYHYNGTCAVGVCECNSPYTGTYCQLYRPEFASLSLHNNFKKAAKSSEDDRPIKPKTEEHYTYPEDGGTEAESIENNVRNAPPSEPSAARIDSKEKNEKPLVGGNRSQQKESESNGRDSSSSGSSIKEDEPDTQAPGKKKKKKKKKPAEQSPEKSIDKAETETTGTEKTEKSGRGLKKFKKASKEAEVPAQADLTPADPVDDTAALLLSLYGDGKTYPEPYPAGKLTTNHIHERYRKRFGREEFVYSVRFRIGPLGIAFDNTVPSATVVDKALKGQQADISDIKDGDILIAVDQYNTTEYPAKDAQRLIMSLPWPKTLVFRCKPAGIDPTELESIIQRRTYNVSVVYPPSLVTEFQIRVAEWAPNLNLTTATHPYVKETQQEFVNRGDFCPVFKLHSPPDQFGCDSSVDSVAISPEMRRLVESEGEDQATPEETSVYQMFQMMVQESLEHGVAIEPRSVNVIRRGICSFSVKLKQLYATGAVLGVTINTENELAEMERGKEVIDRAVLNATAISITKEQDATLLQIAIEKLPEAYAIITPAGEEESPGCSTVKEVAESLVDRWPHSIPHLSNDAIMFTEQTEPKFRALSDEGGRMVLSGENGWSFFDYHLAMFGPQEVPLGPHRFQLAMPPFGCDPNAYTVRIKDTVVAILRGGGCSFGIKVINAQKLGAKAVVIVNTDDKKTMRLMALPDEVPLINISCIMVSRRVQYYVEAQLDKHFIINQHVVSMQPTGLLGDYEMKSTLPLPAKRGGEAGWKA